MSEGMAFDETAARRIERAYQTADVVAQRAEVLRELSLAPGESVLDIGVGPGLLAFDLARAVGEEGSVLGIDPSLPMVEMSCRRCAEQPWARFEVADACSLPCGDEVLDAAVTTQVYEYVPDVGAALDELWRVLKPGGRALILDTDYDSFVLHTEDSERSDRVLRAWDEHFVHRGLPRALARLLREAGFELEKHRAIPMFNADYHAGNFSYGLLRVMAAFAAGRCGVSEEEAAAWLAELDDLGSRGEFFFSLNRYLFLARKPA